MLTITRAPHGVALTAHSVRAIRFQILLMYSPHVPRPATSAKIWLAQTGCLLPHEAAPIGLPLAIMHMTAGLGGGAVIIVMAASATLDICTTVIRAWPVLQVRINRRGAQQLSAQTVHWGGTLQP